MKTSATCRSGGPARAGFISQFLNFSITQFSPLLCYLLLASLYLFYLPNTDFVVDDWFMLQNFEQARAQGPAAQWAMADQLLSGMLWGTFRMHWLSLLSIFGIYQFAGLHPAFYFLLGILLHSVVAFLLYQTLVLLEIDSGMAFLAGAFLLLLPTARNPLFWFPSSGQYVFAAFWFLIYLRSVAGTVKEGTLRARAAVLQAIAAACVVFSTDQGVGLALGAAPWLAICGLTKSQRPDEKALWGRPTRQRLPRAARAAAASAAVTWTTIAALGFFYARFVSKVPLGSSVTARFSFSGARFQHHLAVFRDEWGKLLGFGAGYYRLRLIGFGALAAAAAGLVVFWWLRRSPAPRPAPVPRALLLGAGLAVIGYGPVWMLGWEALRYYYLPSLGLAVLLAAACFALLRRPLLPAAAGLLVAYFAATAFAEMQQCWKPQSRNLQAIKGQLHDLKDLRDHDFVVVSGTLINLGTAPQFAMMACPYSSRPFLEMVTGIWGLTAAREIFYDARMEKLALEHTSSMQELQLDDLRRTHVVASEGDLSASIRRLIALEVRRGAYRLLPLKDYSGSSAIADRLYTHDELKAMEKDVYLARRHKTDSRE